ncbi:hypothetical protein SAMN02745823_03536 [Sporobacter termitidis DSM 10068]|uniref:Uncharacterized protein n=1 Tax=Sporobacter termitidis DSM 10068 TaxID=1123282 RepID=A0A1M5ZCV1_9FIRM|nr:hypothetical protein [Sporobacter termitidis]SHI22014.1 hypothetical protein SAMN02745823_03536 [Sporobacter termitidis DSM 10068]
MPRGVKRERNIGEEISLINTKITEYESKIKTLKSQLVFLQKEQEQNDLRNLNKILNESGLSVDEVAKLIKKPNSEIA